MIKLHEVMQCLTQEGLIVKEGISVKETTGAAPSQKGAQNQAPQKHEISGASTIKESLLTDL